MPKPETLLTYHIFLASPGDMLDERQLVRKFFESYNRNIANRNGLEFKVVDWENYSTSGVGRTQALITEQTLDEYRASLVLVIGLLGQRFGTPTAQYESGTEEEFDTAIKFRTQQGAWPEIKWFFRQTWGKQGQPGNLKALIEATEQWQKVETFKQRLTTNDPPLYTKDFPGTDEFEAIFRQDLELWLHDPKRPWNQNKTQPTATANITESPYFSVWQHCLALECTKMNLGLLDKKLGEQTEPIKLPEIFIPLKAMRPSEIGLQLTEHRDDILTYTARATESSEPVPVLELLNESRLSVLIGDPGSGKSALVNYLAWSLVEPESTQTVPKQLAGYLPVRIILRRVAIPDHAQQGKASWLWQALEDDIRETLEQYDQSGELAPAVVATLKHRLQQAPGALFLLDGLDEIPAAGQRRLRLLQAIQNLVDTLPKHTRFVVTARPYAYTDPSWRLPKFPVLFLLPFDQEQRHQFIEAWYQAARSRYLLKDEELEQRIPDLLARIKQQRHLRELAERPLLLTLMAALHASRGRLPEDRAQLYEQSIELLLFKWRSDAFRFSDGQRLILDESELMACLQDLAYRAHSAQRQKPGDQQTADIDEEALLKAFKPILKQVGSTDLIFFLQQHTGILIARAQDLYAFPHRSFQEYLAMGWLKAQTDYSFRDTVQEDPLWWREVFLLSTIKQKKTPRNAANDIRELLDNYTTLPLIARQRLEILCGLALVELKQSPSAELSENIRKAMLAIMADTQTLNINERAEAGRVLSMLGDPRPGVGLNAQGLPDIDWVEVPAGQITLEGDAGTFTVESFYLARYPVTNAQFQAFIEAPDGYGNPKWWGELAERSDAPVFPEWPDANQPRENVSWYEAMAFCAWLSAKLGFTVTLPTEMQWQQAACGGNPVNAYPWGETYHSGYANIYEHVDDAGAHNLLRTTAVGLYPQGQSQQGILDLCGNVWEWCSNINNDSLNRGPAGDSNRSLRGSAWDFEHSLARLSARGAYWPTGRHNNLGFRVCCASPLPTEHGCR